LTVAFLQVTSLKTHLASQDIQFVGTEHEICVPQQRNSYDCGLYMLQFILNFGDEAIKRINKVSHLSFLNDFFISQSQLSHIFLFLECSRL
jgi:Ulp1 family protease